ncbi:MAG TPA: metal-dependent hydrolase [Phycisphaerales bacterium]|nr:metal-dependent hydrolase [Phycisphaerales bacterium]
MPSPIAHGSLALPAWLLMQRGVLPPISKIRRAVLVLWLLFATVAPDADIAISWVRTGDPFRDHGSYAHSLLIAPIFGVLFAGIWIMVQRGTDVRRAWAVGTSLYALHIVMDWMTIGSRGVAMFWPVLSDRFVAPFGIFAGVEHSQWQRWDLHLIMLANETLFLLGVWCLTTLIRRRYAQQGRFLG